MTNKPTQYLVALIGCMHMPTFQVVHLPRAGEEIWCYRCHEYRVVKHVVGMYRAKCDNCRFSRWYGAAKITAQTNADRHVRKSPTHTVRVYLGDELVTTHGHADAPTLDDALLDAEPPPF